MTGNFIWYELLTSEPGAAAAFYGEVLGWSVADSGQAGMDYRLLAKNGVPVAGLMAIPAAAAVSGMQPSWLGYVGVADVDASVARIVEAGGELHMPAMDVPNVGRMAMIADPQGASLYVMTPNGAGPAVSFAPGKPGHGGWHELHATDGGSALEFYGAQFGWQKVRAMDMGPMGTYLMFNCGAGEPVGGMMNDANAPRPYWLYVFNVEDIERGREAVQGNGGSVLMGPHEVPSGEWVIHARDPQGARFALVGPKP